MLLDSACAPAWIVPEYFLVPVQIDCHPPREEGGFDAFVGPCVCLSHFRRMNCCYFSHPMLEVPIESTKKCFVLKLTIQSGEI